MSLNINELLNSNQIINPTFNPEEIKIKKILTKIFLIISESEISVDILRQNLSEIRVFDPFVAYKYLDIREKSNLGIQELIKFMKRNNIFCDLETIKMIISYYDANHDQELNYKEFTNLVIPSTDNTLRKLSENYFNNRLNRVENIEKLEIKSLPNEVVYTLLNIFIKEIEFTKKLLSLLKELHSIPQYDAVDLFCSMDLDRKNYLDENE